jgi:hypothetical protein
MNRTRTSSLDAFGLRDQRNRIYPALEGSDGRTLDLDFTTGVLDSRITFSRAGTSASYNTSNRYVAFASADVPRFTCADSDGSALGLLIERTATNIWPFSNSLNQVSGSANWYAARFNTPALDNSVNDPTNTAGSWKLIPDTQAGFHGWRYTMNFGASPTTYSFSFWAKAGTYNRVMLSDLTNGNGSCTFLLDGTNTTTTYGSAANPAMVAYPNGWYRCSVQIPVSGTLGISITPYPSGATLGAYGASFTGDNSSHAYVYGFQAESGTLMTSYIETTTSSQATRSADDASMTGTNFSAWFNAGAGTVQANFRRRLTSTTGRMVSANDNTANNWIELGASTTGRWAIQQGGTAQASITPGTVAANTDYKIAGAYAANDAQAALGGTLGTADTSVTVPTVDRLFIGRDSGASPVYLDGTISRLIYWPFRQPNATLQSLTQ